MKTNKMMNQIVSILLCLCMVLGMVPSFTLAASAAQSNAEYPVMVTLADGSVSYCDSLKAAYEEVWDKVDRANTITLLSDITEVFPAFWGQGDFTLDLNGHTISNTQMYIGGSYVYITSSNGMGKIVGGENNIFINSGLLEVSNVSIQGEPYDISISNSPTVILNEGATFPGGIKLSSSKSLKNILGSGMAYWQNGKQLIISDSQYELTGSDVVVKARCMHSGSYDANGFCANCFNGYQPATGSGTTTDPYQISNAGQLYWFAAVVNGETFAVPGVNQNVNANGKLTRNITVNQNVLNADGTLNGTPARDWKPIGSEANPYGGTFDGAGHTISGLYCDMGSGDDVGLFRYTSANAVIQKVGILDSYFDGYYYIGGIVGSNFGKVMNCYNTGSINGYDRVGGIVGHNGGSAAVSNCYSTGVLRGNYQPGGVEGYYGSRSSVTNCYYLSGSGRGQGKSAEQFASGEVTYLLNGGVTDGTQVFYQTCGVGLPAFSGDTVYQIPSISGGTDVVYSNENYVNGFDPDTGEYQPASGSGTKDDPYLIGNAGQLYWFADVVNNGNTGAYGKLIANITVNRNVLNTDGTLNGTPARDWTPIGSEANPYDGTFDGAGHSISGLYFDNSGTNYVGLFGSTNKKAIINDVSITDSWFRGCNYVGGVCGYNHGTITNCCSACTISGSKYVGGIVGRNMANNANTDPNYQYVGKIENCHSTGKISGNESVGGVMGFHDGTATNCSSACDVSGSKYVGGVVGINYTGELTFSHNTGDVTGGENVGGVAGANGNYYVRNCYNTGKISGTNTVGGVVGSSYNMQLNSNCYNTGDVSGTNNVGGVVGYNYGNSTYSNCYNTGNVTGNEAVGGVAGVDNRYQGVAELSNCYYLSDTATGGINGTDVTGQVEARTAEEFASGEVSYLLSGGVTDGTQVFYQTCGEGLPAFSGQTVYMVASCDGTGAVAGYSNTEGTAKEHTLPDALCTDIKYCAVCSAFMEAAGTHPGFTYTADSSTGTITEGCTACDYAATITLVVPQVPTYTGGAFAAEKTGAHLTAERAFSLTYYRAGENGAVGDQLDSAPVDVGTYIARLSVGAVSVDRIFTISPKMITVTGVEVEDKYYDGTPNLELDTSYGGFAWNDDGMVNVGDITITCTSIQAPSADAGDYAKVLVTGLKLEGASAANYVLDVTAEDLLEVPVYNIWYGCETKVTISKQFVKIYIEDQEVASIDAIDQTKWSTVEGNNLLNGHYIASVVLVGNMADGSNTYGTISLESAVIKDADGNDVTKNYDVSGVYGELKVVDCTDHTQFVNGFCTNCAGFEAAQYNEEEYDGYYEISNAGQLFWFAEYVNNVSNEANAKLTANITIPEGKEWTPIGSGYPAYTGSFDGQEHTISGLYVDQPERDYVGLFGNVSYNPEIKNLMITNSTFIGNRYVGALTGYGEVIVSNIAIGENVTVQGNNYVGGMIGYNSGSLSNCYAYSGSFVGYMYPGYGSIENCYFLSDTEDSYDDTTAMTAAQFAGGEVAFLLQSGIQGEDLWDDETGEWIGTADPKLVWGQTIGTDAYPTLGGAKVYQVTDCKGNPAYSNTDVSGIHVDADNSGRCDACGCLMQPAKLRMASISLKGNIAINYYMLLSDEVLADETAYMQFTMLDGEILRIPVSQGVEITQDGETYYVFSCAVDAKEMTDDVICQFFYNGGSTDPFTYTVKAYADAVLETSNNEELKALLGAMLDYGAASQLHFGYHTERLASDRTDFSGVTIQGFDTVAGQGTELAKFYSASLILKSETTLRFFFQVDSSAAFTATYNGQALEVKERSGLYYVDVVGISAKDLDENVTITINDGTNTADISFSPMSYCQSVLNDTTGAFGQDMKDLVSALYLYNQAANVYFKES